MCRLEKGISAHLQARAQGLDVRKGGSAAVTYLAQFDERASGIRRHRRSFYTACRLLPCPRTCQLGTLSQVLRARAEALNQVRPIST